MGKPSLMAQYAKPQHKAATRMLGYTLALGNAAAWERFGLVLTARLTLEERAALAFASLQALDPDSAELTACAALGWDTHAMPLPPLNNTMDEAAFWADMASPDELAAYCLASFNAMHCGRQTAFLQHIQGRKAA